MSRTGRLLRRVAAMGPAEIGGRVAISVRREAARVAWTARKTSWRRTDLARALALDAPLVRDAASDLGTGAVHDAEVRLARHLLTRPRHWPIAPNGLRTGSNRSPRLLRDRPLAPRLFATGLPGASL